MMNEVRRCHGSGYYVSWWDGHVWRQSFEKKCFHLSCHKLQSSSILYLPAQPETIGYAGTKIPQPRDLFLVHITRFQYVHKYLNILCNKGIFLSGLLQSKCLVCWDSVWDLDQLLEIYLRLLLRRNFYSIYHCRTTKMLLLFIALKITVHKYLFVLQKKLHVHVHWTEYR